MWSAPMPLTIAQPRSTDYDKWAEIATARTRPVWDEWERPRDQRSCERHKGARPAYQRKRLRLLAAIERIGPASRDRLWLEVQDDFPVRDTMVRQLTALKHEGLVVLDARGGDAKWRVAP